MKKTSYRQKYSLLISILFLVVSGCTSSTKLQHSGFLDDYSMLKVDKNEEGAFFYRNDSFYLYEYNRVLIEPVEIYFHPDSGEDVISKADLKKIRVKFYMALANAVKDRYPLVNFSGEGVLRIRTAITNVKTSRPITSRDVQENLRTSLLVEEAYIEAEFLDSVTGKQLAALVDPLAGQRAGSGIISQWGEVGLAFKYWAQSLRDALDKAHQENVSLRSDIHYSNSEFH